MGRLKDLPNEVRYSGKDEIKLNAVLVEDLKKGAIKHIKAIQSGSGVKRDKFPEDMKGSIAKDKWNDSTFTLGLEYGFMIGLMEYLNITGVKND